MVKVQPGSKDSSHCVIEPDKSPETSVPPPFGYKTIELIVLKEMEFLYPSHSGGRTVCRTQEELVSQEGSWHSSDNSSDHLIGD